MHLLGFILLVWFLAAILPGAMRCLGRVLLILGALALLGYFAH